MNIAQQRPMSVQQFLAWEERQDRPFEFDGYGPHAMTGGTIAHDRITFNLQKLLDAALAGKPCRPFGPNVKVVVAGKVRYPNALVTCSPVVFGSSVIENPVVVFEVLSEDGARTDRIEKLREYQATPSIRRYVILEQKSVGATVFTRQGDVWPAVALAEGDTLAMPEIGIAIALSEIYAGVELPSKGEPESQE
ncbi:MAG TPA: Uma2 family endonuclease [Rhizomicrobium sp.]